MVYLTCHMTDLDRQPGQARFWQVLEAKFGEKTQLQGLQQRLVAGIRKPEQDSSKRSMRLVSIAHQPFHNFSSLCHETINHLDCKGCRVVRQMNGKLCYRYARLDLGARVPAQNLNPQTRNLRLWLWVPYLCGMHLFCISSGNLWALFATVYRCIQIHIHHFGSNECRDATGEQASTDFYGKRL